MVGLRVEGSLQLRGHNDHGGWSAQKHSRLPTALAFLLTALLILPGACPAQVGYVARFTLDKEKFLQGEPIFCSFVIKNTGTSTFSFRYRSPDRALDRELEGEPNFSVTTEKGRALPDPAPSPCGGAKGSVVYGSDRLPPGQVHAERWLLNQWARMPSGRYRVRAERRLPLLTADPASPEFTTSPPAAYALAVNELSFEVTPSSEGERRAIFQPYLKMLDAPPPADPSEAVLVLTTLPQPFFLDKLVSLARAPASERRWNRERALEGLARLGTPAAWGAILKIARGEKFAGAPPRGSATDRPDDALRAYAILLIGEKADSAFFPALFDIIASSADLRGDALRALGFLGDARANDVLFENLHSANSTDRVNAILGVKSLNSKESIPALLAMLRDPAPEVRQVANFALQALTGEKFKLSAEAGSAESERVAARWHHWWQDHAASFVPAHEAPCHDW